MYIRIDKAITCFVNYEKAFDRVEYIDKAITCNEADGNKLERQKTSRRPILGEEHAMDSTRNRDRWAEV